jgi:hypothetical protein
MLRQQILVQPAGILAAPAQKDDQPWRRLSLLDAMFKTSQTGLAGILGAMAQATTLRA